MNKLAHTDRSDECFLADEIQAEIETEPPTVRLRPLGPLCPDEREDEPSIRDQAQDVLLGAGFRRFEVYTVDEVTAALVASDGAALRMRLLTMMIALEDAGYDVLPVSGGACLIGAPNTLRAEAALPAEVAA